MIVINCALMQNEIIKIVENIDIDNEKPLKFIKKQGIKMYFDGDLKNTTSACSVIKSAIKSTPVGKALYFNVVIE